MRKAIALAVMCAAWLPIFAQSRESESWTVGTILDVQERPGAKAVEASAGTYDVSVKVGDTIYVVLYVAPAGREGLQYRVGRELPVLVRGKTLVFTDVRGDVKKVPILSHKKAPSKKGAGTR